MKITVSRQECQQKLADIQSVVEKKSTMPVLSHFLLVAGKNSSSITATDLETAIREPLAAEADAEGKLCIPARKLFEIVREIDGDITIESEDSQWIRVKAGQTSFRLACLPSEDYPAWPDLGEAEQIEVPAAKLSEMIDKSVYAAGESDTRYTLNGILFHIIPAEGKLTLVGTDGHRMAVISKSIEDVKGEEKKLIVQRKAAAELRKFLPSEGSVKLSLGKNHILFSVGGMEFLTRLIEGAYPNYSQVIPASSDKKATIDREQFAKSLKRVSIMSRERSNAVRLDAEKGMLTLSSSNPDLGEARDEVPADYDGEPVTIGFNAKYLIDALVAMESFTDGGGEEGKGKVIFEFQDPLSPTLLKTMGGDDYRCVVMPMRI
ncbi:MAG: DNA polymerase III subunit beta [Nitrospiraceae bacterium]|nr:DNA polymerase III subunit beta [Nitrospiraceae bacterium]